MLHRRKNFVSVSAAPRESGERKNLKLGVGEEEVEGQAENGPSIPRTVG